MFKKHKILISVVTAFLFALQVPFALGQEERKAQGKGQKHKSGMQVESFNMDELESNWTKYTKDKGFQKLVEEVKGKGFERVADEKTQWGFTATLDEGGKRTKSEVCAYDFYKKTDAGIQMCSLVWQDKGTEVYKAYVVFPLGEKDWEKAIDGSTEMFIGKSGNIEKAQSFNTCFRSCIKASASFCLGALAACGGITVTLAGLGLGLTLPIALGILGVCAGFACLLPLAVCAVRC